MYYYNSKIYFDLRFLEVRSQSISIYITAIVIQTIYTINSHKIRIETSFDTIIIKKYTWVELNRRYYIPKQINSKNYPAAPRLHIM